MNMKISKETFVKVAKLFADEEKIEEVVREKGMNGEIFVHPEHIEFIE